jgi:hypothetical protein
MKTPLFEETCEAIIEGRFKEWPQAAQTIRLDAPSYSSFKRL